MNFHEISINKLLRICFLLIIGAVKVSYAKTSVATTKLDSNNVAKVTRNSVVTESNIVVSTPIISTSIISKDSDQFNNITALDQDQSKMMYMKRQIEIGKLQQQLDQANGVNENKKSVDIHVIGVMINQNGIKLAQVRLGDGTMLNLTAGESFNGMTIQSITMTGITVINDDCKTRSCLKTSSYHISPIDDAAVRNLPPRQDNSNPFASGDNIVPPLIIK